MPLSTLSFVLTPSEMNASDYDENYEVIPSVPYLRVSVEARVNGQPLHAPGRSDELDATGLLIQGSVPGDIDIFTCGCGVAGCAGIFEDCELRQFEDCVQWVFPDEPFRQRLDASFFDFDGPLTLTFSKAQYEQALANLEADIEALRLERNLLVAVSPHSGDSGPRDERSAIDEAETFPEQMARCRERHFEYQARCAAVRAAEGELANWNIRAELSPGVVYAAYVAQMAWGDVPPYVAYEDRIGYFNAVVKPRWLADPLAHARTMSAQEAQYHFFAKEIAADHSHTAEDFAPAWPGAVLTLDRNPAA